MSKHDLAPARAEERPAGAGRDAATPISCYIRTLNEERRIGEVIRAALQVADEVVLIDSGSKDATLAIAAAEGARVVHQPWLGNGRQKRAGEDAARHDWVLDLDADEVVSPELAAEIRALFAAGPRHRMYELTLITVPPFGEPWWNFKHAERIKLYDKRHIRIPDHAAYDQFEIPPGERPGKLRGPLMHYAFTGIEHVMTKLNRASSVRARELKLKPLWLVVLRILFGFPTYFFKAYIVNGLIRGGVYGFAYACALAFGRWLRDVKMYERHMRR
ncbi:MULTISPECIES: glycosyltransferase family 2 protein [Rhodomicrobium]|uniref:glycosyltransferase family 2 protein n=1 Tax=Rhodomicrobium TaxID=1068 RepID=UPI00148334EB|nr:MULTISPECIES: glycosyltransferase family 2 protein [Rhodomicrobium]